MTETVGRQSVIPRQAFGPWPGPPSAVTRSEGDGARPGTGWAGPGEARPVALRLSGDLDLEALEGAVQDVLGRRELPAHGDGARHPASGTGASPDGTALVASVPVPGASPPHLADAVAREAGRALDPAGPPVRVTVFGVAPRDHVLLVVCDPAVLDAPSVRLLLDELAHAYGVRTGTPGRPAGPGALGAPGLAAARPAVDPERTRRAVSWWTEHHAGLEPMLDLPTDRPRPVESDAPVAADVPVVVPAPLRDRVAALADEAGATPFAVLLAAWQALFARVCATDDVPVAVPDPGRRHPGGDSAVGALSSDVVLRAGLGGDPSGRDLVGQVGRTLRDAAANLGPSAAGRPFQIRLSVDGPRPAPPRFGELDVSDHELGARTAVCEWDLALREEHSELRGHLSYRADLFTERTAERLVTWYLALLAGMTERPGAPVGSVPLEPVTGPLIVGPERDYPVHRPLHSFIEEQTDRVPDRLAVVGPDGSLSYAALERRANSIAHLLVRAGVTAEQPVAVLLEPSVDLVCALLGILKAGGVYLPLDVTYPAARIDDMAGSAGARTVLTTREFAPAAAGSGRRVIALDDPAELAGLPQNRPEVPVAGDQLMHIIYTSGSTGRAKGVAVEHRSVVNYVHAVLERLGDVRGASFAVVSTPAADFGLTCVFGALTTGGTVHLIAREVAMDPRAFSEYLAERPVDVLKCVPSHLELLTARGLVAQVLPRKLLVMSGEPCPWSLVDRVEAARPDLRVQSHYGHTESTMVSFVCETAAIPPEERIGVVPIGTPLANLRGYLLDPAGRILPRGVAGELVVRGPGVSRGYVGRPELTADRFVTDPMTGEGRCYRSGDRLRHDSDGTLRFVGRTDDQVKIRGFRVEPGEVTVALRGLPSVAEAVVLAVGEGQSRRLAAWLVPRSGQTIDVEGARASLREHLPPYMVPASFTVLERLPLTANGKIDRAALATSQPSGSGSRAPLLTPTEQRIGAVWAEYFGLEQIGADDDFFVLQGDSLAAAELVRAIHPRLRVIDLLGNPTVAELARFLDSRGLSGEGGTGGPGDVRDEREAESLLFRFRGPAVARRPAATVVCVPYGGGSAAVYQPLAAALARRDVDCVGVELPGHDPARPGEPLLGMTALVDRLVTEIMESVPGPVVVYGHCVGTAPAIAVARRLEDAGRTVLAVVAAGGFPVAQLPGRLPRLIGRVLSGHRWASDRLHLDAIRAGGALSGEMDPQTVRTAVGSTRHDSREAREWYSRELASPDRRTLRAPVLALVGEADRVTDLHEERHTEWLAFTERVELAVLPGADHFFQRHQAEETADVIARGLAGWTARSDRPAAGSAPAAGAAPGRDHSAAWHRGARAYQALTAGHFAALAGTALAAFGLVVQAYRSDPGGAGVGWQALCAVLPLFLRRPLGRLLADRVDRRTVLMCCDLGASAGFACWLARGAGGSTPLWAACLLAGALSVCAAVRQPVCFSAAVQVAPKSCLAQVKTVARAGGALVGLAAASAGAALYASGAPDRALPAVCLAAALTGLAVSWAVRVPPALFRKRDEPFGRAVAGGGRFLARRPQFAALVASAAVVHCADAVLGLAALRLALNGTSAASAGLTVALACLAVIGGTAAMVVGGGARLRARGMALSALGAGAGGLLIASGASSTVLLLCGVVIWSACAALRQAHWSALLAVKAGRTLAGRVSAVHTVLTAASLAVGGLLSLPVAAGGQRALALTAAVILAGWGAGWLAVLRLWPLEDRLPDVSPGALVAPSLDEEQRKADAVYLARAAELSGNRPQSA
ncbi:amino acid adenylation domain-containing protein [Streptomyces sp. NPDC001817]|uniref:amino acid adenylation domain-containing protein n=1 Tax=Streptomyces sp. NPDC001817 TaxID=3154398 RepID=UPI003332DBB9